MKKENPPQASPESKIIQCPKCGFEAEVLKSEINKIWKCNRCNHEFNPVAPSPTEAEPRNPNSEIIAEIKTKYNLLNVNEPIWNDLIDKARDSGWNDALSEVQNLIYKVGIVTKLSKFNFAEEIEKLKRLRK